MMIRPAASMSSTEIQIRVHTPATLAGRIPHILKFLHSSDKHVPISHHPAWLNVLQNALKHTVFGVEAHVAGHTCGFLPLAFVESFFFGKFLVSLPYLNTNGVLAESAEVRSRLIYRAVQLTDELDARHLELRQETHMPYPLLTASLKSKVHMRKALPANTELLWKGYDTKVRNQIRKAEKVEPQLTIQWGGIELIDPFYSVLCQNMRDLGTPVYGRTLFEQIMTVFPENAEFGIVRQNQIPIACALLLHGRGITEIPTASSLKEYNATCANMWMYHQALTRSVQRGQRVFDFGRSTLDGPTFKFKKQWGAEPHPAIWQYYSRKGEIGEMRPDNPRYARAIRIWQRLPVRLTEWLGPPIIRGIP